MTIEQPEMSAEEWRRYARQIGPGVLSRAGQQRLRSKSALITRAGGVGGPAALGLVMAGIGRVVIAHGGSMIVEDLNRQLLGDESVVGSPRAPAFAAALRSMNRHVEIVSIDHEPNSAEAEHLVREVDVVLTCAPTFGERLRLNRAAVKAGVPLVDAAQWGLQSTLVSVDPGRSACLQCLYPEEPPFEEFFPVVGALANAVGSLAATEAIKILSGTGAPLFGKMLLLDMFNGSSRVVSHPRRQDCPICKSFNPQSRAATRTLR